MASAPAKKLRLGKAPSAGEAMIKPFAMIVAATQDWGIGKGGQLPWRLK